ncbi:carbohydrate ABC transporter permease [Caldicellulosiruptor sp. DIB 104C]|uniref:carbohydrate ABC transporter permease n=1 Tax=Caldicellulosiruptor sp. DIB 104C TaxID=3019889 RepID=UPI002306BE77|nr:carbohydrate ABC transporter permease [Caldicellulosiruptor sp. DIB 104C]
MQTSAKYRTTEDLIIDIVVYTVMIIVMIATLYPFWNILAISLNDALDSIRGGIYLWPRKFTLNNYRVILSNPDIYHATLISVLRAVIGSITNVLSCLMVAYGISRKDYIFRKFISRVIVFTMYFSGGLIPTYLLMKNLHLVGTFWVYILPGMVSAFNIIVIRSYIDGLPQSLIESAKIDGASEYRILFQIIMPLCLPVLATVTLWVAVGQWNSWFDTFLYNSGKPELSTLQFELQKILQSVQSASTNPDFSASLTSSGRTVTPTAIRATMTIVATVPILFVYPFLQRYFIHGLTIGSIKE